MNLERAFVRKVSFNLFLGRLLVVSLKSVHLQGLCMLTDSLYCSRKNRSTDDEINDNTGIYRVLIIRNIQGVVNLT
jgi:hypothetical protein